MNNAELFKKVFGIYAEEFWAYPTDEMLNWLTYDATDTNAGDLISRQAAIDELYHVDEYNERSVKVIRNLPSAQQWIPVAERKVGEWEKRMNIGTLIWCSECGWMKHIGDERNYNYCPNCGAEMKGE